MFGNLMRKAASFNLIYRYFLSIQNLQWQDILGDTLAQQMLLFTLYFDSK